MVFPRVRISGRCSRIAWCALLVGALSWCPSAFGLVTFDFEQKYFVHPGLQTWDFSLIRSAELYHIFYHTARVNGMSTTGADTVWHAESADLKNWEIVGPAITHGQGPWDEDMTWAPHVFRDDANRRWAMVYTGVDDKRVQRICLAYSNDLYTWAKEPRNPVIEPDSVYYRWSPSLAWSDFRDPFVWRKNNEWHVIVTAKRRADGAGVLYHGTSVDLLSWTDVGPLFVNDGPDTWRVLESAQYHVFDAVHHLLFGEFDTVGASHVAAPEPLDLSMDSVALVDYGYAPEINEFDAGQRLFSRLAVYLNPVTERVEYCVRLDTLQVSPDGTTLTVMRPHPLDEQWAVRTGSANLGNPTFGDNPVLRGDPSVGLVGNGFYGSQEYFQGPLSGRGAPGTRLGDGATGQLHSRPFTVTGRRMDLLVGGGDYPQTCYVALFDAGTDTIIYRETGTGQALMIPRSWNLDPLAGREVYVGIIDVETGPMGYINVDDIRERDEGPSAVDEVQTARGVLWHRTAPNPFNPRAEISFALDRAARVRVSVTDVRGRLIWQSLPLNAVAGDNGLTWHGETRAGGAAPAGVYLYSIAVDGAIAASGKFTLVR